MPSTSDPLALFNALLDTQALQYEFQPIADIGRASVLGYEALMRGPQGSALRSPEELLRAARSAGRLAELERAACLGAIAAFPRLGLPGKLFVNLSAPLIEHFALDHGRELLQHAHEAGLSPDRLVLELTEHERVEDADGLQVAMKVLAARGITLAIDDFGDGRSSLRLWVQLRPQIVKLDKYFVHGLQRDSRKLEVVRTVLRLAEVLGTPLVAEGIEDAAELAVLRDLGCDYAQGYYIGRPAAVPASSLSSAVLKVLGSAKISVLPTLSRRQRVGHSVDRLKMAAPAVAPDLASEELFRMFGANPDLHAVAVVTGGLPLGLVNRRDFVESYAQPFYRELNSRRPVRQFMNADPICAERSAPLDSLINVLAGEDQRYLHDGFIVTEEGRYVGVATGESLVRAVTELRIEAARHANPLTLLPGNIPVTEHIARLLDARTSFAACYFDLNNFKPYNDLYGYWRGDEMIKLAAEIVARHCDRMQDFVGHVGGDDFVVLFQSDDWAERCERIVAQFNREARRLFDVRELQQGGFHSEDRRGFRAFFPLTTIAVGEVAVSPGQFRDPEEVASAAAAAKKIAKLSPDGVHLAGIAMGVPRLATTSPPNASRLSPH
ncbi:EAL domain-containing protein [Aromatoleum anaerobium]|uniref:EAL domain-containing protein n=1 Tax=Aromatoleum anaerobium TaxID=182180 RepID=A0ABX1PRV9_9RHOO|nr:EAL domain-containing protein [Aromatoleum anaerobium]MCK0506594.1 EAL domain-containing protein [Aromatoleum anaerobium]